jgi:hypothetical protein
VISNAIMSECTSLLSDELCGIEGTQLFDDTMADSRTLRRPRVSTDTKFAIVLLAWDRVVSEFHFMDSVESTIQYAARGKKEIGEFVHTN